MQIVSKLPYLNIGCGSRYHTDWTNIDILAHDENVIPYNLIKGIPYDDNSFEVVYHSHVLEHIPKDSAALFLKDCFRILKKGGILRIAVPDLEAIAREYIRLLDLNLVTSTPDSIEKYNWIKMELLDQLSRNTSGGYMAEYISNSSAKNRDYVINRIGLEGELTFERMKEKNKGKSYYLKRFKKLPLKNKFKILLDEFMKKILPGRLKQIYQVGSFRINGEVHQWMYDRLSLKLLLESIGFSKVEIKDAYSSNVRDWVSFGLDSKNGKIYKADSLFVEAIK